ncbi:multidrug resistance-associated ABC transporter [Mycena amicta]|nr:multidrug resistance-associated ABC transporter [Mycena amicta]
MSFYVPIALNALAACSAEDPLDVMTSTDLLDGYPIQEDAFWAKMKVRKKLAFGVALQLVLLQIANLLVGPGPETILHLTFALYVLAVTFTAISRQTVHTHTAALWHLSLLNLFAAGCLGFGLLRPEGQEPVVVNDTAVSLEHGFKLGAFACYVVLTGLLATTPCGPALYYPPEAIYSDKMFHETERKEESNVAGIYGASPLQTVLFSYTTKIVLLGLNAASTSLEILDFPILAANMRATVLYTSLRRRLLTHKPAPLTALGLLTHLIRLNSRALTIVVILACFDGVLFMSGSVLTRYILEYLERDLERVNVWWGLLWVAALFASNVVLFTMLGQIWGLSTATLKAQVRNQLNTVLFAKTLARKNVASSVDLDSDKAKNRESDGDAEEFESKAQVMTLMTIDADRVATLTHQLFQIVDVPIALTVGIAIMYNFLGISAFFGLGAIILCIPLNHFAGQIVSRAQDGLMKARDARVGLMNEVLGGIRMIKFMAWERSFEARVGRVRDRELGYQKVNYLIEALCGVFGENGVPVLIAFVSFYHFAVIRGQELKPSVAFASVLYRFLVLNEVRWALNGGVITIISILQSLVSLRRIAKYLDGDEVALVRTLTPAALPAQQKDISLRSCTIAWSSNGPSSTQRSRSRFILSDLNLTFPSGDLSLVCGKLGSGKTLLLLALLGECDVLNGQLTCPRSPANFLAGDNAKVISEEEWVVDGVCAYAPQVVDNILFNLPYDQQRYHKTLEACALLDDLAVLEDGDESEIGERGLNLSGGQKARDSRASILLLDDVLSAVDAHTAHHLYHSCLKGDLMRGRTIILISHNIQLCAPGAAYIVALDSTSANSVGFAGSVAEFDKSGVMEALMQAQPVTDDADAKEEAVLEATDIIPSASERMKPPKKLAEDEHRAVGRVEFSVWRTYMEACGPLSYWALFLFISLLLALSRIAENGWLGYWTSGRAPGGAAQNVGIYSFIACAGLLIGVNRLLILYTGALHASASLHKRILESILFARMRFHDTVSRGRVLNRFGKDLEAIDSNLPNNIAAAAKYSIQFITTVITFSIIGGPLFIVGIVAMSFVYYQIGKPYSHTARDLRRLGRFHTRSPLYSMYSETIAGVVVVRAFGAPSKFLRDMLRHVDTNCNPSYWTWAINSWLQVRMLCLGAIVTAFLGVLVVTNKNISAATAGFALSFGNSMIEDLLTLLREFVNLEQAMVAAERIKEYSELPQEPHSAHAVQTQRPIWPPHGAIRCEELVVRYAEDLPDVLHGISFDINPGEKIGIIGRTGSGKSSLALSLLRIMDPTLAQGKIFIDGVDISTVELAELRRGVTMIPQDPTILSGTLRSTLDVWEEYQDADIFEALRRVHLMPAVHRGGNAETANMNVFRNLDSPVLEGGENFSTGEKQLLCIARAILKRSKILIMDERGVFLFTTLGLILKKTCSVDYASDELIGKSIRGEFKDSTILTIAHRIRTVIDYDRIMLLEHGRIVEFDKPSTLLANPSSKVYAMCKATGRKEFSVLKDLARAKV